MSTFYKPIPILTKNIPMIVYPMKGIEEIFDRSKNWLIEDHINKLLDKNIELYDCTFQIIILWKDAVVMTDIWLFINLETEAAGFTVDCKTYQGFKKITESGITASDGLIMLGRESELEESLRKEGLPLIESYILGKRPQLPGELNPSENYFI